MRHLFNKYMYKPYRMAQPLKCSMEFHDMFWVVTKWLDNKGFKILW